MKGYKMKVIGTFETIQENYKYGKLISIIPVNMISYKYKDYIFTTTIDLFEIFISKEL